MDMISASTGSGPVEENRVTTGDAAEPAAAPAKKAGRNLPAAIAVGVLLGGTVLVSLLTVRQIFVGIVAVAVAMGTYELAGALKRGADIRVTLWPVLIGGQAMVWLSWPFGRNGLLAAFVVTILACLIWRFRGGAENYLRDVSSSILTAAYVPLFASFAAMLVVAEDGVARVLSFLIVVVCNDVGGYTTGAKLGRHPMAPTISPKKSWEGFAGSMIAGIAAGTLAVVFLLDGQWWQGALFGAALVCTATVGDLVESLIKRDLGIKDMGTLLPGHGGLMDRLDSLLPSAVVSWLLLQLFITG
jgi:phosphatidate cytidylyltransferase